MKVRDYVSRRHAKIQNEIIFKTSHVPNSRSGLIDIESFSGPLLQKVCISDRGLLVGGQLHIFSNGKEIEFLKKMDFSGPDLLQPIP